MAVLLNRRLGMRVMRKDGARLSFIKPTEPERFDNPPARSFLGMPSSGRKLCLLSFTRHEIVRWLGAARHRYRCISVWERSGDVCIDISASAEDFAIR